MDRDEAGRSPRRVRLGDVEDLLISLLERVREAQADDDALGEIAAAVGGIDEVACFRDAGVLTRERGLVLRCADGSGFEITIVRSE